MSNGIKISYENADKIHDMLAAVNGNATAHTLNLYTCLTLITDKAESKLLELLGSKKNLVGASVFAVSGKPVSRSYKYSRRATAVTLVRRSTGWFLDSARVIDIFQTEGGTVQLRLNEQQNSIAIAKFSNQYVVHSGLNAIAESKK